MTPCRPSRDIGAARTRPAAAAARRIGALRAGRGTGATGKAVSVSGLKAEVDPAEVGLDAERLRRIDRHFARYVDDGRLPGWLLVVSRRGRLAHVSRYGSRDLEAGLPVEPDTLWRLYSMTKPVTSVAA